MSVEEMSDSGANLIPNPPNVIERLALRVLQRPIIALQTRHDRTLISAAHRDQHLRSLRQLSRQLARRRARQIEAHLVHRGDDFRMDVGPWIRAGGNRPCLRGIGQLIEPRGGHL